MPFPVWCALAILHISSGFWLLRLDGLVVWDVYLVCFSVCMLFLSTMFRVRVLTVLCGCAGAVAPGSCSGTVTTSFFGRKLCYLFCLNFNFYGFQVLLLELSKVRGWCDLVGLKFWVWPYLCGGTASLKFRQFNSAVCDAFGVFFLFCFRVFAGVVVCLVGVGMLG